MKQQQILLRESTNAKVLYVIIVNHLQFANAFYLAVLDKINLIHVFLEKFLCAKSEVVISKLARVDKEPIADSKTRKAMEKRNGPTSTKSIPLKGLMHHENSGKQSEKDAQDNFSANVT